MKGRDETPPYLEENLWGYGKRLRFVNESILKAFPQKERSELKVLDVGCGNGSQLTIPLARSGFQILGIDPHWESIQLGRKSAPEVVFHHGVLTELPVGQFDCVIMSEILEHLEEPEGLLASALSYLSKFGILIVTVPNGYGEFELDLRLYRLLRFDKAVALLRTKPEDRQRAGSFDRSPHIQRFTLARLRQIFAENDLQLVDNRATSFASGPFVAHLFGRSRMFIRVNARLADHLPLQLAAGWMFALRRH